MPASGKLIGSSLACPFFMPTQKFEGGAWLHPSRLPLGAGWRGRCCAPGHEGEEPSAAELTDGCNLGYAVSCSRMPEQRSCDAVRFSVTRDLGSEISFCFVTEHAHLPVAHGVLTYDVGSQRWTCIHPDERIQKMAGCYLESYLLRRGRIEVTSTRAQAND
ncbi:MAG TPA: hypothetical protein VFA68_19085 [Terriglobales bacterium]|nr:hypothetical protein [Terriglobales bacterium]